MRIPQNISRRQRQSGTALLIVLGLLSIAVILGVCNHMTLRRLDRELKLLETQQQKKYTPPALVATNMPASEPQPRRDISGQPVEIGK